MKIGYDPEHDVMNIEFLSGDVEEGVGVGEGIIVDYSKEREIVSIELLGCEQEDIGRSHGDH